jgi:hypothetical protein
MSFASFEGMFPVKLETWTPWMCGALLMLALGFCMGCGPEMPTPPPKVFGSSAEEDFDWAMTRMKHAFKMFRPSSSDGLSMKRELDYELIPPSKEQAKYTARVTIATRAVFRADLPSAEAKKRRAEANKEEKVKLDNPFKIPNETGAEEGVIPVPEVPLAELNDPEIAEPQIPTQQLKEKKDFFLEYASDRWELTTPELEENERMLFDYALQQGEFGPDAALDD